MPEHMKESEAWREIARRIAEGDWNGWGLCAEVGDLGYLAKLIDYDTEAAMLGRIGRHQDIYDECIPFVFPKGEQDVRVLAALLLAEEAESEGR